MAQKEMKSACHIVYKSGMQLEAKSPHSKSEVERALQTAKTDKTFWRLETNGTGNTSDGGEISNEVMYVDPEAIACIAIHDYHKSEILMPKNSGKVLSISETEH